MSDDTRGLIEAEFAAVYFDACLQLNALESGLYERFGKETVPEPHAADLSDLRAFVAELRALKVGFEKT